MSLFNLSPENQKSKGTEGVEYKVYEVGTTKYHILNIENEEVTGVPKTGFVEVSPVSTPKNSRGKERHVADASWTFIRDKNNGYYIGNPLSHDPVTGKIVWQRWNVKGKETYDLSIPSQRMKWIMLKNSPYFIDSPNRSIITKTLYKAIDREEDAKEFEINRRVRRRVTAIVDDMPYAELREMAYMLGWNPDAYSRATLHVEMCKFVENPSKIQDEGRYKGQTGAKVFMELYESETRNEYAVFKRGKIAGVITESADNGFMFGGTSLGFSESEAVKTIRSNSTLFTSIDMRSKKVDDESKESMRIVPKTPEEIRIAELERQLEMANKAKKEAEMKALGIEAAEDLKGKDPEYAGLLVEAKRLQIPNPHTIGGIRSSLETKKAALSKKIEEVKNSVKN